MRLITWNVNRRVSLLAGQAAALASREPAAAHASSKLYRQFLVHELRPGAFAKQRPAMPARLLIGSREPLKAFAAGFRGDVEIVDGAGHFLPEEKPQAVAERIRAMCG